MFADNVAVVTGAARGIGFVIARDLAGHGAVVVIGDVRPEEAESAAKSIRKLGGRAESYALDVTRADQVDGLLEQVINLHERIDILVNNAGVSSMSLIVEMTEEDWDFNMNTNAKGVFLVSRAVARQMIRQGSGKIVNIASVAGKVGAKYLGHYVASKHAVIGLTRTLALELAPYGITVNAVCPGYVKTSMQDREVAWEAKVRGVSEDEVWNEHLAMVPLGRPEEPEDVAKVVTFLASPAADYVTGQAINVAGGNEFH